MPYVVNVEGWYTFEHRFRDNGSGVLAVDLTLKNSAGVPQMMWTLSDPSDVIGSTVGGNRYGWFVTNEFPFLAFDNSALIGFQDYCETPPSTAGAKVTGGGWIDVWKGHVWAYRAGKERTKRSSDVSGSWHSEPDCKKHRNHIRVGYRQLRSDSGHSDGQRKWSLRFPG